MGLKRLLVVDDNTVNLATVEKALKGKYEVIPMISGKRALKFLYCQRVDIILLDVEMPEMDGVETLEKIRALEACEDIPVVFLTAKKDKKTVLEGARLKIADYIIKPFNIYELSNRIELILKKSGRISYDKAELVGEFDAIIKELEFGDLKQVTARLAKVIHYDTDEEILERAKSALVKANTGDREGAISVITRINKILQAEVAESMEQRYLPKSDMREKLYEIIYDLDNFKTKEASEKCKELAKCPLPKYVLDLIEKCVGYLEGYDDEKAEDILKQLAAQYSK